MHRLSMLAPTWESIASDLVHLGVAYALALPIGWNREREDRSAGLRTFRSWLSRLADSQCWEQGMITGIGFIGGGAILRDKGGVTGMATAASVWNIGIVGAAVGLGLFHIAVVLAAINLITLKVLTPLKHQLDARDSTNGNLTADKR